MKATQSFAQSQGIIFHLVIDFFSLPERNVPTRVAGIYKARTGAAVVTMTVVVPTHRFSAIFMMLCVAAVTLVTPISAGLHVSRNLIV